MLCVGQDDLKKMKYYVQGIRNAQKELGLKIESFPNLGLHGSYENGSDSASIEEDAPYDYESPAQSSNNRVNKRTILVGVRWEFGGM
jgi:hypothetical protein